MLSDVIFSLVELDVDPTNSIEVSGDAVAGPDWSSIQTLHVWGHCQHCACSLGTFTQAAEAVSFTKQSWLLIAKLMPNFYS